ncbi:uncharacterized protein LOC144880093 isoform X2 [Branchiostoma floridae x Branchiostoma japonicum]
MLSVSLRRLAGELGTEWRSLGIYLGLLKSQVDQCFINHPGDVMEAIVDMLVLWQQLTSDRGPEAQVADLVKALKDISRVDLAERVEDGDFIEHTDPMAGNRELPDQVAGNRVEATGSNVIIQAGNNANINVHVPAPITEPVTPGYTTPGSTSLPDLSRTHSPFPMPRTVSQDNFQPNMAAILNDCVSHLKEMGFPDQESCRREVQYLISTGLNTRQDIVQRFVERQSQAHEGASGHQPNHVHVSKDSSTVTVFNNEGPVQIGKGNIISGVDPSSMKKAVQIGEENRISPNASGDQNLGERRDRPTRPTHRQQSFPNNTQPQQGRFMDNSMEAEIRSSERNRILMEHLQAERAASQMAREVLSSDGQDWPPILDDASSSSVESDIPDDTRAETSQEKKREPSKSYPVRHGLQGISMEQLHLQPASSTFDSLDGTTFEGGQDARRQARRQKEGLTTPNMVPLYNALPKEKSLSKSSLAEMQQGTSPQNATPGSPNPSTDVSISDESLRLQSGGTIQDNQASNWPETGLLSSIADGEGVTARPLGDLYPRPHVSSMPALMDCSIPSWEQQQLPQPAVPQQQNTVGTAELNNEEREPDPQLTQNEEDRNIGRTEEPGDYGDEETVPKVPSNMASANNKTEGASASVYKGADGNQPVYDREKRLCIFSRAHIEEMTENFSQSKKIAEGAFGPVYFSEKFPYNINSPLKDRPIAVKVNHSEDQGHREFMQELAMAGSRHPHLLPLIGVCEDEGCLALVYTYMENEDLLKRMKDQAQPLSYKQRLLIALDLISAVLYYFSTKRFHRDIKSANVLLDRNNRARLADPGLMKELPSDKSQLSQSGRSMTRCGTANYQDPYYVDTGKFHETSDQYSAGKVLLELLTGKPADAVDEDEIVLFHNWRDELEYFRDTTGKGLCEVADHSDEGWPEVTEDGNSVTQRFAKLVIGCLQPHPRRRSNLEVLYQELKDIATTAGALGSFSEVMPTMCTYCLACKPCPIPMACGCALLCTACMKTHTDALYCPKHHAKTTGLGQNTFAVIVGQMGFEEDAKGFKSVITKPHICGVREENVRLLLRPTIGKVEEEVAHLAAEIEKVQEGQDTFFIFYFSGHGSLQTLYFQHMPLTSRKLRKICQKSKATKSLLILDACHSSSVDGYTIKGGSQGSGSEAEEEEEEHHDNNTNTIQKAPQTRYAGSIVWASSLTAEQSGKKGKYSVFTKYIISCLQEGKCGAENCTPCKSFQDETKVKGVVSQNHLRDFVYHHVTKEVQQTPSEVGQRMTTSWIAYAQD